MIMLHRNRIIAYSSTLLGTILILLLFTLSGNAQTLYSCNSPVDETDPVIHTINPDTGATLTTTEITLAGFTVRGCNGLAMDPTTGVCWILISASGADSEPTPRILATIDQDTGVAMEVGDTGLPFAGITFDSSGTLYGITGDQRNSGNPQDPETLFMLSKTDGSRTFVQALGNGGRSDGEAIGFNPLDGLIYRASGNGDPNVDEIFESINPNNNVVTPIPYSGDTGEIGEVTALVQQSGNVLLAADVLAVLNSITTSGVVSSIGEMDHISKGLAFDCVAPPRNVPTLNVPTLSEWGLIAMAGVLGIVGLLVLAIRRRKVVV